MPLIDLPDRAKNVRTTIDAITFAQLVLATVEEDINGNTAKQIYARGTLHNARQTLQRKVESMELEDTSDG